MDRAANVLMFSATIKGDPCTAGPGWANQVSGASCVANVIAGWHYAALRDFQSHADRRESSLISPPHHQALTFFTNVFCPIAVCARRLNVTM
jgi:hypothetical protein